MVMEYLEKKRDPVHVLAKKKYDYLDHKLTLIKQLVDEFDSKNSNENAESASSGCSNESKDSDSQHY